MMCFIFLIKARIAPDNLTSTVPRNRVVWGERSAFGDQHAGSARKQRSAGLVSESANSSRSHGASQGL